MSEVFVKNEALPTFEPIQPKGNTQKRKRDSTLNENKNESDQQKSNRRVKAKKNFTAQPVLPSKSVVWIGATLMHDEEGKEITTPIVAAFSIFYGLNDKRNLTEKVTLKENQSLSHVYVMGAIRALEKCEDENTILSIHTGTKDIQSVINQEQQVNDDEVYNQIKEKIAKRKGSTYIRFKDDATNQKNEESNIAHKMAADILKEESEKETDVVQSLEVTDKKVTVVEETITEEKVVEEDVNMTEVETVITTTEEQITTTTTTTTVAAPSWADTLSLRNLLDILKAPFVRNKKN